jgi:eukaryotic-like serine/threonine-protein kinase
VVIASGELEHLMAATADRHLLFGLIALQVGLIDQAELVAAFQAWARDKARPLAEHLVDRGGLDSDGRAAVEAMVALHQKKHSGDTEKSLAAIPAGQATCDRLAALGDPALNATIVRLASGPTEADAELTATYTVGRATSDGQRFHILRPHARGGLGAVYVALDGELNREVALKQILERHADDSFSRQRFIAEAHITGGLEHPGVVPVYGLGTDAVGHPYYAMRFIKGDSLKEAISRFHQRGRNKARGAVSGEGHEGGAPGSRDLALRKLLRRFLDVCNAVDYAHSRGVIHRDLKPSNIIIGKYGETLVVDWGLAKAVGRADPSVGEQTVAPGLSGTEETLPGCTLGTPPYMSPEQARGELSKVGARSDVYSLGATLYCVLTGKPPYEAEDVGAILRAVEEGRFRLPSQLEPSTDKALEAICMKAMATSPDDRYPTPRALADDLERWMADEPVSAWREPFSRRARRWARRNRAAVSSLAAAVLVALAGTAAVLVVQTRANGELMDANLELLVANDRITAAHAELKAAHEREKQRFNLAMEAIKFFHGEVGDDLALKADQFKSLRDKLLRSAAEFYGKLEGILKDQPDRNSRAAMGNAYFELGELTDKIGDRIAALAVHQKGLAVRQGLVAENDSSAAARDDVARSLHAAAVLLDETGDTRTGRRALAMESSRRALAIEPKLADLNPTVTEFRSALALTHHRIGNLQSRTDKPAEGMESYRRALLIEQKLADENPTVTEFQSRIAGTYHDISQLQSRFGKPAAMLDSLKRALVIEQKLADNNPTVTEYRRVLARTLNDLGLLESRTGQPAEALEAFRRALVVRQKLADENPNIPVFKSALANTRTSVANLLRTLGRLTVARESYELAIAGLEGLVRSDPSIMRYRGALASSVRGRGLCKAAAGDTAGAVADTRRAISLLERMRSASSEHWYELACCHAALGSFAGLEGTGISAGAREVEAGRAIDLLRRAAAAGYKDAGAMATEIALDPLRSRGEFRLLMLDMVFPEDVFAW